MSRSRASGVDLRAWAEKGAQARLQEIEQERSAIRHAFPGLLEPERKAKLLKNMAKARLALAKKRAANGQ